MGEKKEKQSIERVAETKSEVEVKRKKDICKVTRYRLRKGD